MWGDTGVMEDSSSSSLSSSSPYAGEDLEIFQLVSVNDVQCSVLVISLFYFSGLPACPPRMLLMWGLTTHWSPRCFCLKEMRRLTGHWTDFSPSTRSKSLPHIITDQAQWSMWNVSLGGIHSWSLPALLAREIFWEKHKQLFLFEDLTFPHKFYIYLQDNSVLRWHTLWFIFFSIYQFPWSDKLCNCFWSLNLSIILQLNRGWNIEDCALQINTDILLVQIIWFFSWSEFF